MNLPRIEDAPHKLQMYRLLAALINDNDLSSYLIFKGGTCAALRGWLDRFSVDLDFDLAEKGMKDVLRKKIRKLVKDLGFGIKDESVNHLQFFLKYDAEIGKRNTLKLEINDDVSKHNKSEIANLRELNLLVRTQTQDTMVANKLVAAMGRYKDHGKFSGRDFYDLRYFLANGYGINLEVVEERIGKKFNDYITELVVNIETKVTDELLYEDLNPLLSGLRIKKEVKNLRQELLWLLRGLLK